MRYRRLESPLGRLLVVGDEKGLRFLEFEKGERAFPPRKEWRRDDGFLLFRDVEEQLQGYFSGRRRRFRLELAPEGTPFQRRVWEELVRIPYGETLTYTELARRAGRPSAIRAAGAANGRNPISIVIPCHRVLGKDGSLTGYGGGLSRKETLLELEGALAR
jgi:methylated-DNA-[protein]-cysteine S-methyltransferase